MKRLLMSVCCILLIAGMLLSACGNPKSGGAGQNAGSETNRQSGEKIKLHVTEVFNSLPTKSFWEMFEREFEAKYPQYELELENIPSSDSPEQFYKTKIAAGEFPDIAKVWQPALLISAGVIQEIPQDLAALLSDPEFGKVNGKLYAMPQHMGALGMWYNKDIFKRAGIDKLPETWDEFIKALESIKAIGVEPLGMAAKDGWYVAGPFNFLWSPMTYGPDPDWPKRRTAGEVKFNNPVTKRALEQFAETIPYWQKGALSATYDQVKGLFFSGEVAIMANGGIYNAAEVNTGELDVGFEIGYMPMPQDRAEDRRVNVYKDNLWVINSEVDGKKMEAVSDFIRFFYSSGIYVKFLDANASMPTAKGFESYAPTMDHPVAAVMVEEIRVAMEALGTVTHAHAAQGDNIWPQGAREMSEKIVQELAAGNQNLEELMNMFDEQWDKGAQQMAN